MTCSGILQALGSWYIQETVKNLKLGDELSREKRREFARVVKLFSIFSDCPGFTTVEEHCIDLTSSTPTTVPSILRYGADVVRRARGYREFGNYMKKKFSLRTSSRRGKEKDVYNRVFIDYWRCNKLTVFNAHPPTCSKT
ncbi:Zinc finger protein [Plakobranchus ocellatus]|uniref:Zinc finger protein n=1 Tax=Plakobranchus ocellatus TaxID=259542 RepID=A0AAV4B1S5_9GAST|nr:Zinc finger protein [Plakobranchus ocellatus]